MTDPRELLHDTRAHLLAAILAQPDEDTPRLMYADWLEEFGDDADRARAEFIRVQCELAKHPRSWPECPYCGESDGFNHNTGCMYSREWELLEQVGGQGVPPAIGTVQVKWSRGFVESVGVTAEAWLKSADDIIAAHPVREVTITGRPDLPYNVYIRDDGRLLHVVEVADVVLETLLCEMPGDPADFTLFVLRRHWPDITFRPA